MILRGDIAQSSKFRSLIACDYLLTNKGNKRGKKFILVIPFQLHFLFLQLSLFLAAKTAMKSSVVKLQTIETTPYWITFSGRLSAKDWVTARKGLGTRSFQRLLSNFDGEGRKIVRICGLLAHSVLLNCCHGKVTMTCCVLCDQRHV